jgi:chromosome segregation ATPase
MMNITLAPEPQSVASQRLDALHQQRNEALAAIGDLQAKITRLERAKPDVRALEAELASLNAAESAAMSAWARADDGSTEPDSDVARRSEIMSRLDAARVKTTAVDAAIAGLQAKANEFHKVLANIAPSLATVAALCMIEEVDALTPQFIEAKRATDAIYVRIQSANAVILTAAHAAPGDLGRPIFVEVEAHHKRTLAAVQSAGSADDGMAAQAEWKARLAELIAGEVA